MIIKEIFSKFKDNSRTNCTFFRIPGVFKDQGHFQGLIKVCANPALDLPFSCLLPFPITIGANFLLNNRLTSRPHFSYECHSGKSKILFPLDKNGRRTCRCTHIHVPNILMTFFVCPILITMFPHRLKARNPQLPLKFKFTRVCERHYFMVYTQYMIYRCIIYWCKHKMLNFSVT